MTTQNAEAVKDLFPGLFAQAEAAVGAGEETPRPDLVRTGQGWPTFEEIMDQVPEGPAKEATEELRGIVRLTPIRVTWDGGALPPELVCPPEWRRANPDIYGRAREVLLFRGAWEVVEDYIGRAGLLLTFDEAEGEAWGRA